MLLIRFLLLGSLNNLSFATLTFPVQSGVPLTFIFVNPLYFSIPLSSLSLPTYIAYVENRCKVLYLNCINSYKMYIV